MPKKQLPIFATQRDLSDLLHEICVVNPIDLVVMGLFDRAEPTVVTFPEGLQPLTSYLVLNKGVGVVVRSVPQRKGGLMYAIDPIENPISVVLHGGGFSGADRLIAGSISVASDESVSLKLFALFSKVVGQRFEKVKSFYLGPEAALLFKQGLRLSPTAKSPELYDLSI